MRLNDYLKDKMQFLLFQILCMMAAAGFFWACKVKAGQMALFFAAWSFLLAAFLGMDFYRKKRYFDQVFAALERLDQPWLIGELLPDSPRLTDRLHWEILRRAGKSLVDEARHLEREHREYREFIEGWIHEAKRPLSAITLAATAGGADGSPAPMAASPIAAPPIDGRRIQREAELLSAAVDRALFYARSDGVYRDYVIRRIKLLPCVYGAVDRCRYYLMDNHMEIRTEAPEDMSVYCDGKWLEFILVQLLMNAVQYKKEGSGLILIRGESLPHGQSLTVEDRGIGIPPEEVDRVFDKGFTGTNGRDRGGATGIGLYLCRKLCRQLGMEIEARSERGTYTCITLLFPDGGSLFTRDE